MKALVEVRRKLQHLCAVEKRSPLSLKIKLWIVTPVRKSQEDQAHLEDPRFQMDQSVLVKKINLKTLRFHRSKINSLMALKN
jgi:hypothetical protein